MTKNDLLFVEANKEKVIDEIISLCEKMIEGEVADSYFYITGEKKIDSMYNYSQHSVMHLTKETLLQWVENECVNEYEIKFELENQINLSK